MKNFSFYSRQSDQQIVLTKQNKKMLPHFIDELWSLEAKLLQTVDEDGQLLKP